MPTESFETELDLDNPGKPVVTDQDDQQISVEIVDDTPPEDRNRAPLPETVKQELDEDDPTEEYSEKVKQRIARMKKAWHDERRAKEAATRERDEAIRLAQQAYYERQQSLKHLESNEAWALEHAKSRAQADLEAAKRAYRDAYEAGETDAVVEAQQRLQLATIEYDRVVNYQPPKRVVNEEALQPQPNQVYRQPQTPQLDPKVVEWSNRNRWFGVDPEMTNFAMGVHQRLVQDGVSPESDEYYERLDARIRQVYPDQVGAQPAQKRQSPTVVAPVGRAPKGKKVVLTKSQLAVAKKLGITPEEYAKEMLRLEGGA
jgi:hypothetical protein